MNIALNSIIGFLAAVIGSMGLGGGGVLLMYLSAFTDTDQLKAQGINLVFFIPIAVISVIINLKNRLIDKKAAVICALSSVATAILGAYLSLQVDKELLRKILAVFLLILGVRELISSFKNNKRSQ